MDHEQLKCGDDCKLVEMLANKTSKEQAMENAIAAVQTGNISQRGAAKRFKVNRDTLSRKLKEAGNMAEIGHDTTQSAPAPGKSKAADKAERDQWFADHQAGLSARKIAEKFGRSRLSITKEIKRRKQAEPESELQSALSVQNAESATLDTSEPITPTGELNKSMKIIVKRERISGELRMKAVAKLSELKKQLEKTWTTAQRERTKLGASIHAKDVEIAEKQLVRSGDISICESLTKIADEAEAVRKAARQALYHLHFVDMP